MKFSEAIKEFENGNSIRKIKWAKNTHLYPGCKINIDLQSCINDKWELYVN